ncbi:hypothetical protein [Mesorhizobium sp. M0500]|uniref:hypothetical protein n=1 Tax=Mesorhizobium sp. M0500 TaxID=2956953 RepID=UPI00333D9305
MLTLMPRNTTALGAWDGNDLPDEQVYAALVKDLQDAWEQRTMGSVAVRMNYELPGTGSQFTSSARKASTLLTDPYKAALIQIDPLWERKEVWNLLRGRLENRKIGISAEAGL